MRPTDLLHKPVISSAAADRALGADAIRGDLKHGLGVIIQSAHQPRVDDIANPHAVKQLEQVLLVILALVTEIVADDRRAVCDLLAAFNLAIQHAKRVGFQAHLAGFTEFVIVPAQVALECFVILRTAGRIADAVEANGQPAAAEAGEQFGRNRDAFRVCAWLCGAEKLHPELMVLTQSSRLRALITKRRAIEVKHLCRLRFAKEIVLHKHAYHSRRAFRF
ncbi:hypothetical protein SDC9_130108 [bioreactor metagenome]|uniref:Uncharacterized protein n=1 Tax=bioreactor metagenome TaxID=1076179 RepID=A0A645D1L0_9ZZZZ